MGRPEKTLDPMQKSEVETLAAVLTAAQIADYFGIGRTTFFAMMERDPEIAERYKRGKAKVIGTIAQGLINKARGGDTASMNFFLKTHGGWRETAVVEHVGMEERGVAGESASQILARRLQKLAAFNNPVQDKIVDGGALTIDACESVAGTASARSGKGV